MTGLAKIFHSCKPVTLTIIIITSANHFIQLICIESFDPRIVYWFRKNAPDLMRGQLSESYKGWRATTSPLKAFAMSHFWTNLLTIRGLE